MSRILPRAESADIALLLEGTFPYVSGGVSSWVAHMIRSFPEYRFAVVFIGSRKQDYGEALYELPENVVHLEQHYLYDFPPPPAVHTSHGDEGAFEHSAKLHTALRNPAGRTESGRLIRESIPLLKGTGALNEEQFLYSRKAWEYITEQYREHCTDPSFTDYFWSVRIMHKPLWQLVEIAENLIPARVYHTVSTGYAGFLGAILRHRNRRPLLASEHGIYTKERKIDLFQSQWIRDNRNVFERDISETSYFRELWVRFFETLGRVCYDASEEVVALYEGNRQRQVLDGALAERTRSIPNGIDLPLLAGLREQREPGVPRVICLIGRVVPIKDIKTFIRSMLTITREFPDAQGWIAGPENEDPDYALECRSLAKSLGMGESIRFLGYQKIEDLLPKVGVLVLSSISEALPLVVLEGFAAGVPAVTTDVGACRQLIYGLDGDDADIGRAGGVVRIADPAALAEEALKLLRDPQYWHAAQQAGIRRVERYYTQERMLGSYGEIYARLIDMPELQDADDDAPGVCPVTGGTR